MLLASNFGRSSLRALWTMLGVLAAFGFGLLIASFQKQAILPLVAVGVGVAVLWRPAVGFMLVIASLPLDVAGTLGSTALTRISVTKLLASLTLLAIVFEILYRRRWSGLRRLGTPETLLVSLFFLIQLLSAAMHPTQNSVSEVMRLLVILLFVFVAVYFVDRPGRLVQVAATLAIAGTAIAAYSLVQRLMSPVGMSEEWIAQAGAVVDVGEENVGAMLRTTGTFSHPAWLSLYLTICMPFTLGLSWGFAGLKWRLLGVLATVIQLLGVMSTYSRMSYIGAALAIGLFMCRRRFGMALVALAFCATVIAFPALPEDFRNRVYSIVEYRQSSSSLSRIAQQIAGWSMFLDHPALGVGAGNFESRVMDYQSRVPVPLEVQPIGAHNMYIEIAAELGFIGLAVGLLLMLQAWRQSRRLRLQARQRGDVRQELLWEGAGIALAVFAVSALFVHAQYAKEWWLLIGLAAASRQFMSAHETHENREATSS